MKSKEEFGAFIARRFGGVLKFGAHQPDGEACVLEAYSQWREMGWTDDPNSLGMPDVRPLNDGPWSSDQARTKAMIPLVIAMQGWATWPAEQQKAWCERVVLSTVREIIAELPSLPATIVSQCQAAHSLEAAALATEAARYARPGEIWAARAAYTAVRAAFAAQVGEASRWAAEAAVVASREMADNVLRRACALWIAAIA